ncbi:hypothetical protein E2C01_055634 [Portunus trituberculatus]|uniref:Uncharacterized protein n=1 Tax=Portunus trituberculatus TaxID=210409 RepID=A0A5B7GN93_PORTR|nr:hypothetical protein [Portunus trituberculatus]
MSFTSPSNDIIISSRHAKFPLRFRGKYLSFYAVLLLYAQVCRVRWTPGDLSYPIILFWAQEKLFCKFSCFIVFLQNRDPGVDIEGEKTG